MNRRARKLASDDADVLRRPGADDAVTARVDEAERPHPGGDEHGGEDPVGDVAETAVLAHRDLGVPDAEPRDLRAVDDPDQHEQVGEPEQSRSSCVASLRGDAVSPRARHHVVATDRHAAIALWRVDLLASRLRRRVEFNVGRHGRLLLVRCRLDDGACGADAWYRLPVLPRGPVPGMHSAAS